MNAPREERRRDHERRAAVDVALILAEEKAAAGDFRSALQHLAAADAVSRGALARRSRFKRTDWEQAAGPRATPW